MHDQSHDRSEMPIDGAPTWVRMVQAVLIGLVAGLALHALLSLLVLQGRELQPAITAPTECRKSNPGKAPQQLKAQPGARPSV